MTTILRIAPLTIAVALVLAGCTPSAPPPTTSAPPSSTPLAASPTTSAPVTTDFVLTSPDLDSDGYLPGWAINHVSGYCAGTDNRSPALEWINVPQGTASLVVTMTDPAHPTYVHWVVTAIPADSTGLPSAIDGDIGVGITGTNWQGPGRYAGVCLDDNPYLYTVYALDAELAGSADTTLADALELIDGHVLGEAELFVRGNDARG